MDFQFNFTTSSSTARPAYQKDALFSLLSLNHAAQLVVSNSQNDYRMVQQSNGKFSLDIGFHTNNKTDETLAILGRGPDADALIVYPQIARIHSSFELVRESGAITLYDRSLNHSPKSQERCHTIRVQSTSQRPRTERPKYCAWDGRTK